MEKSFNKFVNAWKELADSKASEINEATLSFFLAKHFGTSRNNFYHYRTLSLELGFITALKNRSYKVHKRAIDGAFNSR